MTKRHLVLLCCMALSACTEEDAVDYCRDHYLIHAGHQDGLGTLAMTMADSGILSVELTLPTSSLIDGIDELLEDPQLVYTLQTTTDCTAATSIVRHSDSAVVATYESSCGVDNKIDQLDVVLFDTLTSLEELEVDVVTPVTQKHFAISRQCESAIFRLD